MKATVNTVRKMVCLGDSITWGFPYGPDYSWVKLSEQALGFPMVNRGVNGDTAEDLLSRFNRDVLKFSPSHLFIMVGTNDAGIKVPLRSFQEKIIKMHTLAAHSEINVILGLPVPSSDAWLEYTLQKYRCWLKDYCTANSLGIIDFFSAMTKPDGSANEDLYVDDVHPNRSGYKAMARIFITCWQNNGLFRENL